MPLDRACIGRRYETIPKSIEITKEMSIKYALATNDSNALYLNGEVAPPMLAVVYQGASAAKALFDPDLKINFPRLVHGEQDMEFLEVVRPGDTIESVSEIADMEDKGDAGEILHVAVTSQNQEGKILTRTRCSFFIRGIKKDKGLEEKKKEPEAHPPPLFSQVMRVKPNQTLIYAEASGDHNPIHTSRDFAKSVGLPDWILQGLCTMAFVQKAVVDELLHGDAKRLRRLSVRFSKPVIPGDILITQGWFVGIYENRARFGIAVHNQHGVLIISNGLTEIE